MKALIVYYSLDGHTQYIANLIAAETGADVVKLEPVKELSQTGFKKFFWGGKSVFFNEKPKLKNTVTDLAAYDLIIIGTPVWASSCTPPVNTFISNFGATGKKLAFFACHAGGGAEKCFEKMEKALKNNKVVGKIEFVNPTADVKAEVKTQIKNWLAENIT